MKMNRTKIIAIFGVLFLPLIVLISVWITARFRVMKTPQIQSEKTTESEKSSATLSETQPTSDKTSTLKEIILKISPARNESGSSESNAIIVPKGKISSTTTALFFEDINKAVKKSLMPSSAPLQNISTTTPTGIVLSLTKDQFKFLYPDSFIASLVDAQNLFIKDTDPSYETISKIETDAQVRLIEEKIVDTLLSANMITKERADQFITTIRFTLPQLQIVDLEKHNADNANKSLQFMKFLDNNFVKSELPKNPPKKLFLAGLIKELANVIANKAQAACGSCSSSAECFQEGGSTPGKAGTETIKFACHCTGCLSSLGCLSSCYAEAAIYDQQTGICGCGVGESFDFR